MSGPSLQNNKFPGAEFGLLEWGPAGTERDGATAGSSLTMPEAGGSGPTPILEPDPLDEGRLSFVLSELDSASIHPSHGDREGAD